MNNWSIKTYINNNLIYMEIRIVYFVMTKG